MTTSPAGREIARVEGQLKVTGRATYSGDYNLPGAVHAHVVTSTIAAGAITSMDTAAARRAPGVIRVLTPFEGFTSSPGLYPLPPGLPENYVPLRDREVRFRGQVVGVVVAERIEQARDAAALIRTTYQPQPARTSLADLSPGTAIPITQFSPEPSAIDKLAEGTESIDAALAESDFVVDSEYHQPAQHHVAMEPHAAVASWQDGVVTIRTGCQAPQAAIVMVAARLGVQPQNVRLISQHVGGGFGSRVLAWNDAFLAAAVARELERPVKLVLTREQVFTVIPRRSQVNQRVKLGARRDGRLEAVWHESDAEASVVGGWPMSPATDTSAVIYRTPNLHVAQRSVMLNISPAWAMRGPNEAPGAFALETAMDELAVKAGIDPLELRRRNRASVTAAHGLPWSSNRLDECFTVGAKRFGWSRRSAEPRSRTDGQWLVGMGMASAIYPANRAPASVRVQFHDDNSVEVASNTVDIGTGSRTLMAIAAADALGLPMRQVEARLGDTILPPGAAAAGSAASASTVPGVQRASERAIAALLELAATHPRSPWQGQDVSALRYEAGRVHGSGVSKPFGRLLKILGERGVGATETTSLGEDEAQRYAFHSFGAHFCEVRVNRLTGEPRINRFTSVFDVGRAVNSRTLRSQLIGGIVFGIGHALLEDDPIDVKTGRMGAGNLADYMVAVNADIPTLDVHWLDKPDPVLTEYGLKGAGEVGTVGAAAAVGNAIYNATGVRVRDLPITLDKLI